MASKGSAKLAFGIRKATKADFAAIKRNIYSFNMPHPENYRAEVDIPGEITFIAFSREKILGFITASEKVPGRELYVEGMYNLLGFDDKGVGSKLLGKLNAYAVAKGFLEITLSPNYGYELKEGKKVRKYPSKFFNKTNYKPRMMGYLIGYFWRVGKKLGVRRPKQKPPTMGPQNLLRKDAMLNRRGFRRK